MLRINAIFSAVLALLALASVPASAQVAASTLPDRILGQDRSPVVVEEYISLTCPHCADFYLNTLPEIEKRYVDTGKVRFILRDFPLDANSLKAAALARCMPAEEFYPFIRVLYENQSAWAGLPNPEKVLTQYARLGGLDPDKAKSCLADQGMQNSIVAERSEGSDKYGVQSTPTFIFNSGAEKMEGAGNLQAFSAILDRMLARAPKK